MARESGARAIQGTRETGCPFSLGDNGPGRASGSRVAGAGAEMVQAMTMPRETMRRNQTCMPIPRAAMNSMKASQRA